MSTLFDRTAPRSGEFLAPLPLVALALLVVNDVWWKGAFHNELTGKLSDVAVCFLMPLFLSELLGLALAVAPRVRLATGAALTAVLFTLLEVVPPFTAWTLTALDRLGPHVGLVGGFRMTSDPTDLACVPLVLVAYRYGARRLRQKNNVRNLREANPLFDGGNRTFAASATTQSTTTGSGKEVQIADGFRTPPSGSTENATVTLPTMSGFSSCRGA